MFEDKYRFVVDDVGPALAFIVSQFEGEEYLYECVDSYFVFIERGMGYDKDNLAGMAIVKSGFEKCLFSMDDPKRNPWRKAKIAHIISNSVVSKITASSVVKSTGTKKISFAHEFKESIFPYLDMFIEILAQIKEEFGNLSAEQIMQLANDFVSRSRPETEKREIKMLGINPTF